MGHTLTRRAGSDVLQRQLAHPQSHTDTVRLLSSPRKVITEQLGQGPPPLQHELPAQPALLSHVPLFIATRDAYRRIELCRIEICPTVPVEGTRVLPNFWGQR